MWHCCNRQFMTSLIKATWTVSLKLRVSLACHLGTSIWWSRYYTIYSYKEAFQSAPRTAESLFRVRGKLIKRCEIDPCFRWFPRTCLGGISKKQLGRPASGSRFENKDAGFEEALTVNATLWANGRMMRLGVNAGGSHGHCNVGRRNELKPRLASTREFCAEIYGI
jgi:hypothetical protein